MTNEMQFTDAIDIIRNECARIIINQSLNIDACDAFDAIAIIMNRIARIIDSLINDHDIAHDEAINDAIMIISSFIANDDQINRAFAFIMN